MGLFDSVRSLFGSSDADDDSDASDEEPAPRPDVADADATVEGDRRAATDDTDTTLDDLERGDRFTIEQEPEAASSSTSAREGSGETNTSTPAREGSGETNTSTPAREGSGETNTSTPAREGSGETNDSTPSVGEPTDDTDEKISWEETGFEQLTDELVDEEDDETDRTEADPSDLIQEAEPDAGTTPDGTDADTGFDFRAGEERDDGDDGDETLLAGASGDVGEEPDHGIDVDEDSQRAEFVEAATELAEFWGEYDLDYSVDSLARLDDLIADQWHGERFENAEYGGEDYDSEVFTEVVTQAGSYLGEVFVRVHDGEWLQEDGVGWTVDVSAGDGADVAGATVTVFHVARQAIRTETTVAGKHDGLAAELALSPTVGVDPEPTDIAGTGPDASADDIKDTEVADRLQDSAEDLAERWPDYDLDFSAASLGRLADLIDAEIDHAQFADAELGDESDRASMLLTAHAVGVGGYLAAVLRREYDARWDNGEMAIVFEDGEVLDPIEHAADCIRGTASLTDVVPT